MSEKRFELDIFGVAMMCDKCGKGEMIPYGQVAWLTDPVKFPHKCNVCGNEEAYTEKYPTVRHQRNVK